MVWLEQARCLGGTFEANGLLENLTDLEIIHVTRR